MTAAERYALRASAHLCVEKGCKATVRRFKRCHRHRAKQAAEFNARRRRQRTQP